MKTRRLFITGTDTEVGKTHFTVWLIGQLRSAGLTVGAYKPACSGAIVSGGEGGSERSLRWEDPDLLAAALGGAWPLERIAPQCFREPLAPPAAAKLEAREVDERLLVSGAEWWDGQVHLLLVEGAGGWYSPLSTNWTNADLAARLHAPVVLVAGDRLGVINHSLLTIEAIRRTSPLAGIVLNELSPRRAAPGFDLTGSNLSEIERRSAGPVWGVLSHGDRPELWSQGECVSVERIKSLILDATGEG